MIRCVLRIAYRVLFLAICHLNSDIWLLATHFDFDGPVLAQAIQETFHWRQTALSLHPVAFSDQFTQDREKQAQWTAFIHRHRLEETPATLHEAVQVIADFLQPAVRALSDGQCFDQHWFPGGPWSPLDKMSQLSHISGD